MLVVHVWLPACPAKSEADVQLLKLELSRAEDREARGARSSQVKAEWIGKKSIRKVKALHPREVGFRFGQCMK